ncbi:TPA: hypothetical protein ACH3X3_011805 [Trebouxia sp. C0006]
MLCASCLRAGLVWKRPACPDGAYVEPKPYRGLCISALPGLCRALFPWYQQGAGELSRAQITTSLPGERMKQDQHPLQEAL